MKRAIVTGAGGDIGAEISRMLLSAGWAISGFDVDRDRLARAASALSTVGDFAPIECDVRSMPSVLAAVEETLSRHGGVGALVNNAGAISKATLVATGEADWLADIDLNLNGAWRCINALQNEFIRRRRGVIVNIASVNGLGVYGHPGYSVAKAGLIHLTRFCASEFGKHGVRSVAICPGTVKTAAWTARLAADASILERAAAWYPSRDLCEPKDVASLVEFVMRPSMQQLNGAVISLDGGLLAGSDVVASAFAGEPV